jgi:hypothetical protein
MFSGIHSFLTFSRITKALSYPHFIQLMMALNLIGKVFTVTGGASRIGAATARLLRRFVADWIRSMYEVQELICCFSSMLNVFSDISKSTRGDISSPFTWYLTNITRTFLLWPLTIYHLFGISEVFFSLQLSFFSARDRVSESKYLAD